MQRDVLKEPGDETILPQPEISLVSRDRSIAWTDLHFNNKNVFLGFIKTVGFWG